MSQEPVKQGDRVRLIQMGPDPHPIPPGTEGTVNWVNGPAGAPTQIGVSWDNGRSLMLVPDADSYEVIP